MDKTNNYETGTSFQNQVKDWFQQAYKTEFELEKKIAIGTPAKAHRFDIADRSNRFVIECKRYVWTKTGNVPSAKISHINEAAFYLSFLPDSYEKYIVIFYSFHPKRNETLATYYYRTNRHLLGNIKVAEFNPETNDLHIIENNSILRG